MTRIPDDETGSGISGLARAYRKAAPYISSVYALIASIALFAWLGWLADHKWPAMQPMYFIIGMFVGLLIGFYNIYKILKNIDSDK